MHTAPPVPVIPFEQTAAARMTARIPIIESAATLADVQALFWKSIGTFDTIRDVFVVDKKEAFGNCCHAEHF